MTEVVLPGEDGICEFCQGGAALSVALPEFGRRRRLFCSTDCLGKYLIDEGLVDMSDYSPPPAADG